MQKTTRCFFVCFLISGLFMVSCNRQKKQITEALSQMMDKEIVFPNVDFVFILQPKEKSKFVALLRFNDVGFVGNMKSSFR